MKTIIIDNNVIHRKDKDNNSYSSVIYIHYDDNQTNNNDYDIRKKYDDSNYNE